MGAASSHTFGPNGGTIGRRSGNDWVLAGDPYVSSRHAAISAQGGDYYITDSSSNGTGINARDRLLPKDQPIKLNDGDVLFIGDFEIRIGFTPDASEPLDVFAPVGSQSDPFGTGVQADPFDTSPRGGGSTQTDVPPVADIVTPDKSVDPLELLGGTANAPAIPQPGAAPNHTPAESDYFVPPPVVSAPASPQTPAPGGQQLPEDWDLTGFSGRDSATPADQFADPFAPAEPVTPTPAYEPPSAPPPPPPSPSTPPPPTPPPQADSVPASPPVGGSASSVDLSQVLRGAGIDPNQVSPEFASELGQILSVVVEGMIDVLKARTDIKSQFRVPVTTIKPVENNPLKFSAGVEDALYNLLVKKGAGYLGPVEAFEEGFEDIKAHQMATLAGMRAAFSHMLERFDPGELESVFGGQLKRSSLMAMGNKIKYWEHYKSHYKDICDEAEDNFQRLFGEAFAQAYEEQMQRLTSLARSKNR